MSKQGLLALVMGQIRRLDKVSARPRGRALQLKWELTSEAPQLPVFQVLQFLKLSRSGSRRGSADPQHLRHHNVLIVS